MSIITNGSGGKGLRLNFEALEKIRNWLISTLDEKDLNIRVSIGSLARKTRQIAHITKRGNQPYFQQYILEPLEKEDYCKINRERREVVFLKLLKNN